MHQKKEKMRKWFSFFRLLAMTARAPAKTGKISFQPVKDSSEKPQSRTRKKATVTGWSAHFHFSLRENTASITEHVYSLIGARKIANRLESEREKAIAYHDNVAPLIEQIRTHVDKLEMIVDDELWPLPKYREMLFIR